MALWKTGRRKFVKPLITQPCIARFGWNLVRRCTVSFAIKAGSGCHFKVLLVIIMIIISSSSSSSSSSFSSSLSSSSFSVVDQQVSENASNILLFRGSPLQLLYWSLYWYSLNISSYHAASAIVFFLFTASLPLILASTLNKSVRFVQLQNGDLETYVY